jgi:tripartite-type tricarboxylate transporter receptor subunit TctC
MTIRLPFDRSATARAAATTSAAPADRPAGGSAHSPASARRRVLASAAALAALPLTAGVRAQSAYPVRPIRVIVPFPPGGATDNVARVVVKSMAPVLGQPMMIDNRGGANGRLGTELAAQAAPDGYTLLFGGIGALTIAPHLGKVPYDPAKDFTPISCLVFYDSVLVINPALPVNTVPELVDYLKRNGSKSNYASSGSGGPYHMAFELFKALAGVEATHVPYKGDGVAIIDLIAGNVQCMITSTSAALPHIRAGKIKVIASAGSRRTPVFPEVATIEEQGVRGYGLDTWGGLIGPAGLPPAIVDTLYDAVARVSGDKALQEGVLAQGGAWIGNRPAEFSQFLRVESEKWGKLIRDRRLTA